MVRVKRFDQGFFAISIVGLLFSLIWLLPRNLSWGITFTITFAIMFLAAMISMTYNP